MSSSVEDVAGGYHFSFKVVICGDSGVGKTTLLDSEGTSSYSRGGASDNTVGINFRVKFYEVEGETYRVQFWDCPGAERYRNLNSRFCAGAAGAILVFDVNNRTTFENIELWCEQVDKFGKMIKIVVANKIGENNGANRVVTEDDILELTGRLGVEYFETDALNNDNIGPVFQNIFTQIVQSMPQPPEPSLLIRRGVKLGGKTLSNPEFRQALFQHSQAHHRSGK
eukprot:g870.t1